MGESISFDLPSLFFATFPSRMPWWSAESSWSAGKVSFGIIRPFSSVEYRKQVFMLVAQGRPVRK